MEAGQGFRQKKLVIIIGGIVLFILVIVGSVGIFSQKNQPSVPSSRTNLAPTSSQMAFPTFAPTSPVGSSSHWKTYSGSTYTFKAPENWQAATPKTEGGGEMTIVRPIALPAGFSYPQFILETSPDTDLAMERKEEILQGLGLVKSKITVFTMQADKFSGTIPYKVALEHTVQEPIQETVIIFRHGGKIYKFTYAYEGTGINVPLEEEFMRVVNSVKLQ